MTNSVYLHAGQVVVSAEPCTVTTILGSCVAVCLWDPRLGVGGLNHYLLPYWAGNGQSSPRFGNVAVKKLVDGLLALGATTASLEAKLFGGACVMDAFRHREGHLGTKNVELARQLLRDQGIPVVAEDVGGARGRKLLFYTGSGLASVKLV